MSDLTNQSVQVCLLEHVAFGIVIIVEDAFELFLRVRGPPQTVNPKPANMTSTPILKP